MDSVKKLKKNKCFVRFDFKKDFKKYKQSFENIAPQSR